MKFEEVYGRTCRGGLSQAEAAEILGRVHEYPDGTLAVFHGPRRLARYSASGILLDEANQRAA